MDCALGDEHRICDLYKPRPKIPRGKKECPDCILRIPITFKRCICGHIFARNSKMPQKYKSYTEVQWTEVLIGSIIYIDNNDVWISQGTSIVDMGDSGEFLVKERLAEGLLLYGKSGFYYQNMVDFGYNKNTGITKNKPSLYTFVRKRK